MKCTKSLVTLFVLSLVLCWALSSGVYAQDKVSVDKKDYNEFRLMKIQQEINTINQTLRQKNPQEFKRIDDLVAEAQKIQKEMQPAPKPAAPKK